MKLNSLQDLYLCELKDLYDAEHRVLEALPEMADVASSPDLRKIFQEHLEQSRKQVDRLEQVFGMMNEIPKREKCKGIQGIIDEGADLMDKDAPPAVADAGLIASAQRVEHYEMAAYGTCRTFAARLGFRDQATLLQQSLEEEEAADKKLTNLAESHVNEGAKSAR